MKKENIENFVNLFNLNGYFYFRKMENKPYNDKVYDNVFNPCIIVNVHAKYMDLLFDMKNYLEVGHIYFTKDTLRCQYKITNREQCKKIIDFLDEKLIGIRKQNFNKFKENFNFIVNNKHTDEEIDNKLQERKDFANISAEEKLLLTEMDDKLQKVAIEKSNKYEEKYNKLNN